MDEKLFEERLNKIVEFCKHLPNEVSYQEVAVGVNMAPDIVKTTISIYVSRKQKELEKNPFVAMSGPDESLETLIYSIKELAKARFYIEGQKKLMKAYQAPGKIKSKITGIFNRGK